MKEKDITVVVPVYNVSKYLKTCIESILGQTYRKLDIILIDDGSTDDSGIICDEYKKTDTRIRVFHKKNGGLSSARNVGIENAKGTFITFVDSDDYIEPTYIEYLYNSITKNNCQIAICDFIKVDEFSELEDNKTEIKHNIKEYVFSFDSSIKNVFLNEYHGVDFVAWAKLYRTELFSKTGIRYPEGKLHEDTLTTYKLFYVANGLSYIDIPLYCYRIREGSIMTSRFDLKKLDKLVATREVCKFLKQIEKKDLLALAFAEHLHNVKYILHAMINSSNITNNDIKCVCQDLKSDIAEYGDCISFAKYVYYTCVAYMPKVFLYLHK